jgi:hypothetical protein
MGNRTRAYARRVGVMLSVQLIFLGLAACGGGSSGNGGGSEAPASNVDGDSVVDASDCAPNDATRWSVLDFASVDNDGDNFRVNSSGQLCAGENLPANRSAATVAAGEADCDDADAAKWRTLTFLAEDADGDGYTVNTSGEFCGQQTLPARLRTVTSSQYSSDCDDGDPNKWRRMGIYRDRDGDGSGSGPASHECIGRTPPAGYALPGDDPLDDPNDPSSATVSTAVLSPTLFAPAEDGDDDDI